LPLSSVPIRVVDSCFRTSATSLGFTEVVEQQSTANIYTMLRQARQGFLNLTFYVLDGALRGLVSGIPTDEDSVKHLAFEQ
jgi:hypothetical protein